MQALALTCTLRSNALPSTDTHAVNSTALHGGLLVMPQVLTIHSPFAVENATTHPLQLTLHLQHAPPAYGNDGSSTCSGAVCSVPADGPLAPGSQCYLPQPAAWWVSSLPYDILSFWQKQAAG